MTVYREEIRDPFVMVAAWPLGVFSLGSFAVFFYQLFIGPVGEDPAPTWFWGLMGAVFLGTFWLVKGLTRLVIELTNEHLTVRFGILRSRIPWERVVEAREVGRPVLSYWGVGLRFVRVGGRWVLAYVPGSRAKRVAVTLRGGVIRELVFATRDPGEVLKVIHEHLGEKKGEVREA